MLMLNEYYLTGHLPQNICIGRSLTRFVVSENNFGGAMPRSLKNCSSLRVINVADNQLSGSISEEFGVYPDVEFINLSNNEFFGQLSWNWSGYLTLTVLGISNINLSSRIPTGLSGNIPSEIGQMFILLNLSLSTNNLSGSIPEQIGNCTQLLDLNLSQNALIDSIPSQTGNLPSFATLDLSQNMLDSKLPPELGEMKSIETMNLSHNRISGFIPKSFDHCFNLISVDISYNQLEGPLPNTSACQKAPFDSLRNNKGLCGNVAGLNPCSQSTEKKTSRRPTKRMIFLIVAPILATMFLLTMVVGIFIRARSHTRSVENKPWEFTRNMFSVCSFDGKMVNENIIDAIENFAPKYCIGAGEFGSVFRAELPNGQVVAVKKLHGTDGGTLRRPKEFANEIRALTNIRHRNFVKLYGFCSHAQYTFLVYEFLEGGNLLHFLSSDKTAASDMDELNYGALDGVWVNMFDFFDKSDQAKKLFEKYKFRPLPHMKMKLKTNYKLGLNVGYIVTKLFMEIQAHDGIRDNNIKSLV
ncbi:MDIS1-interacting receptor like kinase 2-like [Coffea eugenioides]|uniref:MDIS1-interacting receptor like kinase 2-like n=1 Tax=Coffea eugenioides TaxID=49369 RepID=UPI000F60B79B|nr:MDIS1-interacting receptor like kinase 2-like [Coffea eugenioides]